MRGDLPSDIQALSFSRELSFESRKGEERKQKGQIALVIEREKTKKGAKMNGL
jgi:hypothetical protein